MHIIENQEIAKCKEGEPLLIDEASSLFFFLTSFHYPKWQNPEKV